MNRMDVQGVTIDGLSSRDLDDALWVEERIDHYLAHISIADVASHVLPGSEHDHNARQRCFTRYFANGSCPMLTQELSEDALSLVAGQPRDTMTIALTLDKETLACRDALILPTRLTSTARLTYVGVDRVLRGEEESLLHDQLALQYRIAERLLACRRDEGALAIYDINRGWATSEEGQLILLDPERRHLANIIVQEFMILANVAGASLMANLGVSCLFRNHQVSDCIDTHQQIMADFDEAIASQNLTRLTELRAKWNSRLRRAAYGCQPVGHFGLRVPVYAHLTSPIRRYADLVSWQCYHAYIQGLPSPYSDEQLSAMAVHITDRANEIKDRRVTSYKRQAFAEARSQVKATNGDHVEEAKSVLALLPSNDFYRAAKVACRENHMTAAVTDEFLQRMQAGQIGAREIYLVFFESQWSENIEALQQKIVTWLADNLATAVAVFTLANMNLGFSPLLYEDRIAGPQDAVAHTTRAAVVSNGRSFSGSFCTASTKKEARQKAALSLLCYLHRLPDPPSLTATPVVSTLAQERKPPKKRFPCPIGGNYANAVSQCCDFLGQSVNYDFTVAGEAHAPTYTCTIAGFEQTFAASGRNKSSAKQAAAMQMYEHIRRTAAQKFKTSPEEKLDNITQGAI